MNEEERQQVFNELKQDWGLAERDLLSEEELLLYLTDRVVYYLEREAEPFFQLMYRLDIPEHKMNQALGDTDPPRSLAKLIYERQLEKARSRRLFKPKSSDDPDLGW